MVLHSWRVSVEFQSLVTTATLVLSALASAQDASRPSAEQALQAKLASPFLAKAAWLTDYDAALAAARRRNTLIFGYFTTANY